MMDEQKKLNLWTFMQDRGYSLAKFGSAEYGLNIIDAIEFIGLIEGAGLGVLGIEKWVELKNGYSLSSIDGWISDSYADSESNNVSARAYLVECLKSSPALYAIQF